MDSDFVILDEDNSKDAEESLRLPVNFIFIGNITNDDLKVYIKHDVYKDIEKLAKSDISNEIGSFLIGKYSTEMGNTFLVITGVIEAKYTDASASTLTFTHETWDYVHAEKKLLFPNDKIVGWQHSHPNYGIFLSNYDLFIQQNFFNLPFQVAYVVDPVADKRGFFQWKNSQVEKLDGFYIFDDIGKPIKTEQQVVDAEEKANAKRQKSSKLLVVILCLFGIGLLSLVVVAASLNEKIKEQELTRQDLVLQIQQYSQKISEQDTTLRKLQQTVDDNATNSVSSDKLMDLTEEMEDQQLTIESQEDLLSEMKTNLAALKKPSDKNRIYFIIYNVKSGDTLTGICFEHGIDYASKISIIKAINGITDVNIIRIGQTILLPKE